MQIELGREEREALELIIGRKHKYLRIWNQQGNRELESAFESRGTQNSE